MMLLICPMVGAKPFVSLAMNALTPATTISGVSSIKRADQASRVSLFGFQLGYAP